MLFRNMFETSTKPSKSNITPEDIRRGMRVVARLIRYQGEQFWPLMERLKRELKELEDRENLLAELLGDSSEMPQTTPR